MATTEDVKIKVSADATQARAEMGRLARGVDDVGGKATAMSKAFSSGIGSIAKGLGTFNLAAQGVVTGISAVKDGFNFVKEAAELERLSRSVPSGALDRMTKATQNAIGRTEGLRITSRALTGDLRLTSEQFDAAGRAADAAARNGIGNVSANLEKIVEVIQKGNVDQLDDFGIAVRKTGDRMLDLANATKALDRYAADTGPLSEREAALRRFEQVLDQLSHTFKSVTLAVFDFGSAVVGTLGQMGDAITTSARESGDAMDRAVAQHSRYRNAFGDAMGGVLAPRDALDQYRATWGGIYGAGGGALGGGGASGSMGGLLAAGGAGAAGGRAGVGAGGERGGGRGGERGAPGYPTPPFDPLAEYYDAPGMRARAALPWRYEQPEPYGPGSANRDVLYDAGRFRGSPGTADGLGSALAESFSASDGEASLDFLSKFSEDDPMGSMLDAITEKSQIAGDALGAFAGAAQTAFAAYMDGSQGFAEAMRQASASALKALSVEYATRAVGHAAWALASIAFENPKGAAEHGLAAAQFGAAAIIAGGGAAALGGGGGSGGARPSSASPAGGGFARPTGGSDSMGGGDTIVINLGDGFYGDHKKLGDAVSDGLRDARRRGRRQDYTTRFGGG